MEMHDLLRWSGWLAIASLYFYLMAAPVFAHCDGLDGPVVKAARRVLETGNVNLVLVWVQPSAEPEIRAAFERALAVRKLDPDARDLADRYFFETLVRIHRAGEGAPYTGLKPAGRDLGPAIPAADRAIETGSVEPLLELLTSSLGSGVRERFREVMARKDFDRNDPSAGRRFVQAYVEFVHYAEGAYQAARRRAGGHEAGGRGDTALK